MEEMVVAPPTVKRLRSMTPAAVLAPRMVGARRREQAEEAGGVNKSGNSDCFDSSADG